MTYTPLFRKQLGDPTTTLDSFICTLSAGAMQLDYQTNGRLQLWGGELVPWCGLTEGQIAGTESRADGGFRTGTAIVNVQLAWQHFGEDLDDITNSTWAQVMAALDSGKAILLQGDYDQFPVATRCLKNFVDGHAILMLPERQGTKILHGDPLCNAFTWREERELRAYAEKLGGNTGKVYAATTTAGGGMAYVYETLAKGGTAKNNGTTGFDYYDFATGALKGHVQGNEGDREAVAHVRRRDPISGRTDDGSLTLTYDFIGDFQAPWQADPAPLPPVQPVDETAARRAQWDEIAVKQLGKRP